jgi:hypothetical protein
VLIVVYSQTGQLARIATQIARPLEADPAIEVHVEVLRPQQEHPFPWPLLRFLDAFPESAHLSGEALQPLSEAACGQFDLVILCYQVWFLAPSLPVTAFLKDAAARRLLAGKPVVTVVACRNMWMMAHRHMQALLAEAGARLIDNVVLTDRAGTFTTLLTTPLWLLTGRKRPIAWLPPAGVSEQEIARSGRFGRALRDALHADRERGDAPLLSGLQAVQAEPRLLVSERAGTRSFRLWGRLIRLAGPPGAGARKPLLALYALFLMAIILTVVPVSLALQALLRPLLGSWLAAQKQAFEAPSGSGTERLPLYEQ